jgi:hypothetical protein
MSRLVVAFLGVTCALAVCAPAMALTGQPLPTKTYESERAPRPAALTLNNDDTAGPGPSPQFSLPGRYQIVVKTPDGQPGWATVRNSPAYLAQGNVKDGSTIDGQRTDSTGGWMFGQIYGSYGSCGWLLTSHLGSRINNGTTTCSSAGSRQIWDIASAYDGCGDPCGGTYVYASRCNSIDVYANVSPWTTTSPRDEVRYYINTGGTAHFYWRYVSKDGQYVMVRDPYVSDDRYANWVFLPRYCFPVDSSMPGFTYISG